MNGRPRLALALVASGCVMAGLGACGLKGPLAMPEKSGKVVIRGQPAGTTPAGDAAKSEPKKLPPPELPRTDSSSSPHP